LPQCKGNPKRNVKEAVVYATKEILCNRDTEVRCGVWDDRKGGAAVQVPPKGTKD